MGLLHISKIESRSCSHREYLSRYRNLHCSRHDACLTIDVGRQGEVAQGVADANGAIRQVAQVPELAPLAPIFHAFPCLIMILMSKPC